LGTSTSSLRYKENVQPMGHSSSKLLECTPVTFNYKTDETKWPLYGLIAEEVYKILPELVVLDLEGNPHAVMYQEMPSMLLNEIIKLRARMEQLRRKEQ
jgi:hypothetical protein